MTLGFGIIVRNCELDILKRCLNTVKGHVDNIYITVADKEEPTEDMKAYASEIGAHLSYFKWIGDFAAARNFNMSQCKDDWWVWADSDDEIEGMEKAKTFLEELSPNVRHVLCFYNYSFAKSGKPDVRHIKERFIRNDGSYTWKGKVHETCVTNAPSTGVNCDSITWNHRTTEERSVESCKRNAQIAEEDLAEQIKDSKPDPRSVFNLGMAYAAVAQRTGEKEDWELALRTFLKFITLGEWDEHLFSAWKFCSTCYMQLERPELALNALFEALRLKPQYSDVHAALGRLYEHVGDDEKAEAWYRTSLLATEDNAYADEIVSRKVSCLYGMACIAARRRKFKDCITLLREAKKLGGDDEMIDGMLGEAERIEKELEESRGIIKQLDALPENEKETAYKALDNKWKGFPELCLWRQKNAFKKESKGNEIAIFTGLSVEEWNPDSVKNGIGGSEEAVINMAKQLKALGWDVIVYGTHGMEPKEYDGVWYKPYWDFSASEPVDVFIGWRDPAAFDYEINAKKKYLWLHDTVPEAALFMGQRLNKIDKVMVLSDYHRSLYPRVPDEKIMKTGNGIDPSHFEQTGKAKDCNKILYTSAPNRGLECLLEMWPKIREKVPNAELYWAYGWETFDKMQSNNPKAMVWKNGVLEKLRQEGVHDLGRIGHQELAERMLSAGVWAYPTEFTEVYCITAVKMQAAGCWPVCTNVAALDEMVQFGDKFDVQDMYTNKEAQEKFIESVVNAIQNGDKLDRSKMIEWAKTSKSWESTAKQWDNEFKN